MSMVPRGGPVMDTSATMVADMVLTARVREDANRLSPYGNDRQRPPEVIVAGSTSPKRSAAAGSFRTPSRVRPGTTVGTGAGGATDGAVGEGASPTARCLSPRAAGPGTVARNRPGLPDTEDSQQARIGLQKARAVPGAHSQQACS